MEVLYRVVNSSKDLEFSGKGKRISMGQALDLFDSLGGAAAGFKVVKARKRIAKPRKIQIDLSSPHGNIFWLISYADHLAKIIGYNAKEIREKLDPNKNKYTYDEFCGKFTETFGEYVELIKQ